jgi:hypothetical protein
MRAWVAAQLCRTCSFRGPVSAHWGHLQEGVSLSIFFVASTFPTFLETLLQ